MESLSLGCELLEVWRYTSEPHTKRDPLNAHVDYAVFHLAGETSQGSIVALKRFWGKEVLMRRYEILRDSMIQSNWGPFGRGVNCSLKSEFDFNRRRRRACNRSRIHNMY